MRTVMLLVLMVAGCGLARGPEEVGRKEALWYKMPDDSTAWTRDEYPTIEIHAYAPITVDLAKVQEALSRVESYGDWPDATAVKLYGGGYHRVRETPTEIRAMSGIVALHASVLVGIRLTVEGNVAEGEAARLAEYEFAPQGINQMRHWPKVSNQLEAQNAASRE